jgi:hypothetical protein
LTAGAWGREIGVIREVERVDSILGFWRQTARVPSFRGRECVVRHGIASRKKSWYPCIGAR